MLRIESWVISFAWNVPNGEGIHCPVRNTKFIIHASKCTISQSLQVWSSALLHYAIFMRKSILESSNVHHYCTILLYIEPVLYHETNDSFDSWYGKGSIYSSSVQYETMNAVLSYMPWNPLMSIIVILLTNHAFCYPSPRMYLVPSPTTSNLGSKGQIALSTNGNYCPLP